MNLSGQPEAEPRRAILLNFAGLGPHYLGPYGNEWIRTTTFDRLAARGVVFDRHYSLTTDPGAVRDSWRNETADLVQRLSSSGIATIRVGDDCVAEPGWVYSECPSGEGPSGSLLGVRQSLYSIMTHLPPTAPAFVVIESTSLIPPWSPPDRWLRYYFFGDESDPLEPWTDPLPDRVEPDDDRTFERIQSTFAAGVSHMDRSLAKLLAGCRTRGIGKNALIIATASLGLPLGEHGPVGWDATVSESASHLPLIVRFPAEAHAGRRVDSFTTPGDVGELIAQHFGLVEESRLASHAAGRRDRARDYLIIRGRDEDSIRTADHWLIRSHTATRLYLQPEDPWLVNDLSGKRENDVVELTARLNQAAN